MPKRVDTNQPQIVKALRQIGASVLPIHTIGKGCPDILVGWNPTSSQGWHPQNFLFEIKDPSKPPSARQLTPDEQEFHERWRGQIAVIHTWEEALRIMQGWKEKQKSS